MCSYKYDKEFYDIPKVKEGSTYLVEFTTYQSETGAFQEKNYVLLAPFKGIHRLVTLYQTSTERVALLVHLKDSITWRNDNFKFTEVLNNTINVGIFPHVTKENIIKILKNNGIVIEYTCKSCEQKKDTEHPHLVDSGIVCETCYIMGKCHECDEYNNHIIYYNAEGKEYYFCCNCLEKILKKLEYIPLLDYVDNLPPPLYDKITQNKLYKKLINSNKYIILVNKEDKDIIYFNKTGLKKYQFGEIKILKSTLKHDLEYEEK